MYTCCGTHMEVRGQLAKVWFFYHVDLWIKHVSSGLAASPQPAEPCTGPLTVCCRAELRCRNVVNLMYGGNTVTLNSCNSEVYTWENPPKDAHVIPILFPRSSQHDNYSATRAFICLCLALNIHVYMCINKLMPICLYICVRGSVPEPTVPLCLFCTCQYSCLLIVTAWRWF